MIRLSEPAPTFGGIGYGRILVHFVTVQKNWHDQNSLSSRSQNPIQLRERFAIVINMFQHVRANEKIYAVVPVKLHVGNIDVVVNVRSEKIGRPVHHRARRARNSSPNKARQSKNGGKIKDLYGVIRS